jgi:O-antigen ligase
MGAKGASKGAAVSDFLAGGGVLVAAGASAAAILLPAGRLRSAAMLAALVLFPVLILGDQWHTPQIEDLREDTTRLVLLGALALAVSAALALAFYRWPFLLPLAIVFALPFRIPLHAGGDTANLLVPLYLVIAGGVLATVFGSLRGTLAALPATGPAGPAAWLPRVLALVIVLYAVQTLYSPDFSKSLQNVCFFFVPFSLVYALLRDVEWDRELLTLVLWVVAIEAVAFVFVGSIEYVTKSLFWNDQVIRSNEFHTYFRVNSVFWDPNVYGRYLALVAVVAMAALLWARERRTFALLTGLVAVVWIGLVPTFSQSSFIALLVGLAVLAALKWSLRWTLAAVGVGAVLALLVVVLAGGSEKVTPSRINIDTSGRANLVSGGLHLFAQRPVYGYGSGSFPKAYREHVRTRKAPVSVSHTEPITVAAEQGIVGFAAYVALIGVALWTMTTRLTGSRPAGPVAAGDPPPPAVAKASSGVGPPTAPPAGETIARVAVLATFAALLVHTMAYAGFYEDPITWVLLAMATSLAASLTASRRAAP